MPQTKETRGQSPSSLHSAFMDSSGHKANILGDYNYVGIGTDSATWLRLRAGDVVLTLGAGDITRVAPELVRWLGAA